MTTSRYRDYNIETVLTADIDIYSLFNQFVNYLLSRVPKLAPATIAFYVAGVKSYLQYYDLEISSKKFQRKVNLPDRYRGNVEEIDAEDIRTMLLSCTIPRLKAYILVLASSGMRALETCSLRISDIDFNTKPTKVHLRAITTKTKQGNDIYISDEATKELISLVKDRRDGLLFSKEDAKPVHIYKRLQEDFALLLKKVGMDKKRDGDVRREISFHSFRRFVKTAISNQGYGDFSEWMLGHRSSMAARYYYTKEQERREIYQKCIKYLTFLDYPTVESVGKDFESKLEERDEIIEQLEDQLGHAKFNDTQLKGIVEDQDKKINDLSNKMYDQMYTIELLQKEIKKMQKKDA